MVALLQANRTMPIHSSATPCASPGWSSSCQTSVHDLRDSDSSDAPSDGASSAATRTPKAAVSFPLSLSADFRSASRPAADAVIKSPLLTKTAESQIPKHRPRAPAALINDSFPKEGLQQLWRKAASSAAGHRTAAHESRPAPEARMAHQPDDHLRRPIKRPAASESPSEVAPTRARRIELD